MAQIQTLCLLPATVVLAAAAVALAGSDTEKGGGNEGCEHFDLDSIGGDWPSIAVIIARGRLGNHLIAFTLIGALAKELSFRPFIMEETVEFLSPYFSDVDKTIPVLERTYCNYHDIPFEIFRDDLDELIKRSGQLKRGKALDLWEGGYLPDKKECCPAEDLQKFVVKNYYQEARAALQLKPELVEYTDEVKRSVARKLGKEVEEITFVGIHNRRTDYIHYMEVRFGTTKNPYNKRYFREAMEYFREDLDPDPVAFLFVSDDMEWARKSVKNKHGDLFFVGTGDTDDPSSVGRDLALLASCQHSITSWGSFSMWAAFMAGGEYYTEYGVIVPERIQEPEKKKRRRKNKSKEEL